MSVLIIAEAGVNHNGDLAAAIGLIDAAADAGADIVKFQTFSADALASDAAPKAEYQRATTGQAGTQREMLRLLELSKDDHHALITHCGKRGIAFLSTPFDGISLDFLIDDLDLPTIKVGSGDLDNGPLLHRIAAAGRKVILSTGMATLDDVLAALQILAHGFVARGAVPSAAAIPDAYRSARGQEALRKHVTLLHCTTEYPAPFADVNLRAMDAMRDVFGLPIGLSDHTPGIAVAIAAAARGACIIEKHLTLDRNLPGPDHRASLEPREFADLVRSVREVESALGDGNKRPMTSEIKNRVVARKSLVAARPIRCGELIDADAIAMKRPGTGLSPMRYWDWLGKTADRNYAADEPLGS